MRRQSTAVAPDRGEAGFSGLLYLSGKAPFGRRFPLRRCRCLVIEGSCSDGARAKEKDPLLCRNVPGVGSHKLITDERRELRSRRTCQRKCVTSWPIRPGAARWRTRGRTNSGFTGRDAQAVSTWHNCGRQPVDFKRALPMVNGPTANGKRTYSSWGRD